MSKKVAGRREEKQLTRKQISRRAREERTRRRLFIGVGTALVLVVLLLAWGLVEQYVLRPRKPVAIVAEVPITLRDYQKQVQYRRWEARNYLNRLESQKLQFAADKENEFFVQYIDQQINQVRSQLMTLPTTALDEMIEDRLIRQEAARRGITVTPEELDIRVEEQFGYLRHPPTPTPTPITPTLPITVTPTPTTPPMTFEEYQKLSQSWYEAMQRQVGFTAEDFRHLMESALYREKLQEAIANEVPTMAEQFHASHILVETREEAEEVLKRLEAGEAFEDLAAELSTDPGSKENGGDLGWFPLGRMVPEFEEAVQALQPGEISGIVETQFGYHIIRLGERDPNRELEPADLEEARYKAFDDWLTARKSSPDVVRKWESSMIPTEMPTPRPQR